MVGASGAIAGILGGYLAAFPGTRILVLVFYFILRVPALIVLGGWFVIQLLNASSASGTSDVVKTDRGAYILRVEERQSVDKTGLGSAKGTLLQQVLSQKRQEVFTAWFADLRESADIVDYRHFFYSDY